MLTSVFSRGINYSRFAHCEHSTLGHVLDPSPAARRNRSQFDPIVYRRSGQSGRIDVAIFECVTFRNRLWRLHRCREAVCFSAWATDDAVALECCCDMNAFCRIVNAPPELIQSNTACRYNTKKINKAPFKMKTWACGVTKATAVARGHRFVCRAKGVRFDGRVGRAFSVLTFTINAGRLHAPQ
ncbi:hypothetical protein EVAR_34207_1 [Eumeta japonica]|uniref:Uncharacterized protein n=1 Tax=Eumeta variegata TaxID=151549 RepID=A0A4C1WK67_EUMVA|nr:hypothetical protein EVAR_34207_1 [Eumeta japonica]